MNWLVFTILSIISRALYSIGTRMLSKDVKVSPITQSILLTLTSGFMGLLISPFVGGIHFNGITTQLLPILVITISAAFGNIIYFKGQKLLDAGMTQIAFSSILIWGTILSAIFLGSTFSIKQLLGILLMLCAFILVQYKKSGTHLSPSVLYIVISAVLFATMQVASAGVSKSLGTGVYLLISYFGPSTIIGIIYWKSIQKDYILLKQQLNKTFLRTLFASGTSLLYFIFSFLAYKTAPDRGVVVVLLTSQVILSIIFGIIFLKEKESVGKKIIAGILAFIAGALIKS